MFETISSNWSIILHFGLVHITCEIFFGLQKELQFDDDLVLRQLRYTGILQMVQVQKSGYSAKYTFKVRVEV